MRILEEFWYGNIEPTEYDTSSCKEYFPIPFCVPCTSRPFEMSRLEPCWEHEVELGQEYKKLLELICRNEEKLQATMTDEQKELFAKYTDCVREYQTITDCLIFQNSFKLGARMMLEVMEE